MSLLNSLPSFDSIHPLVVHFPVAILMILPVLFLVALFCNRATSFFIIGILLTLGNASSFLAVETGEATEDAVKKTEQVEDLIETHGEMAEQMFYVFIALALIYWVLYLGRKYISVRVGNKIWLSLLGIYGCFYIFGLILLIKTAHAGGLLVHKYGVHAAITGEITVNKEEDDD